MQSLPTLCACVCLSGSRGPADNYRKNRNDSSNVGKDDSSWSMAPLTCNSFHATALPGQDWNSIYSLLGKLFFCLCFNISRKKELCFPGQPLLEWIRLLWFVHIIGLLFIPTFKGFKGFQRLTRMSSIGFFSFFFLFKGKTPIVVLLYAPLKSRPTLLQSC